MTVNDILTGLSYRIGENSVPQSNAEVSRRIAYIAQGMRAIVSHMPFWFTESYASLSSVSGTQSYTLPTDFRQPIEVRIDGRIYFAVKQDDFFNQSNGTYNAIANSFIVFGGQIIFSPTPQVTGTNNITIRYYKYPTSLTSATDTLILPDTFADILISYTYMKFWQWQGDPGRATSALAEYNEHLRMLVAEHNHYMIGSKQSQVSDYEYA